MKPATRSSRNVPLLPSILALCLLASTTASGQPASGQPASPKKRASTPPPTNPPLVAADPGVLPESADRLDLYLLLGQSNMKGRGPMPESPKNDPRIITMHLETGGWYRARHPLHLTGDPETFRGHDNAGVGPGLAFAETVLEASPEARIGLVPCAVGGSAIALWGPERRLYENAMRRARLALEAGPETRTRIRGVLWLQGETDSRIQRLPRYEAALHNLVDRLREDLAEPDLPFLAATIGEMRANTPESRRTEINRILLDLPNHRPHTATVDARDLEGHIGDQVHYDTPTQEEIGRRFARLFLEMTR